tara:strand:+ start:598 stop:816 length:219 start_codon:yes stop_codon:yes gene_type:complete
MMTANKHGLVYSGEYHCEGHNLQFEIHDDDTVTVTDTLNGAFKTTSRTEVMSVDAAIELQEKYIKLGYDKIS